MMPAALKYRLHIGASIIVSRGGRYAQRSPLVRCILLRILSLSPWLAVKVRRIHIETQLAASKPHGHWSSEPQLTSSLRPTIQLGCDEAFLSSAPDSNGINARCRTPLEKHFHNYDRH